MNKKELGLVLADRMNLTQVEAKRLTNALFDILMEEISSGVSVKISGFGSFYLRPKLRGSFRRRIVFRPGKTLKAYVEEKDGELRDSYLINKIPELIPQMDRQIRVSQGNSFSNMDCDNTKRRIP